MPSYASTSSQPAPPPQPATTTNQPRMVPRHTARRGGRWRRRQGAVSAAAAQAALVPVPIRLGRGGWWCVRFGQLQRRRRCWQFGRSRRGFGYREYPASRSTARFGYGSNPSGSKGQCCLLVVVPLLLRLACGFQRREGIVILVVVAPAIIRYGTANVSEPQTTGGLFSSYETPVKRREPFPSFL